MSGQAEIATVDACLQPLGGGLGPDDRAGIVEHWSRLDHRLRSFRADDVDLILTVKERDKPSQHTTLEARIAHRPRLVATSSLADLDSALTEVRDDMVRQLTDAKNRTEPRQNRKRRS
jgi:ribosome-associated translation inhibitor RaiA